MSRRAKVRLLMAFVAAALWLPCTMYWAPGSWGAFSFWAVAMVTVPTTAFIAGPLVYWLRRRLSFLICSVCGVAIGLAVSLLFTDIAAALWPPLLYAAVGFLSSTLFWVIGVWRNEDLASDLATVPMRQSGNRGVG